jgi:hypothetical protein
MYNQNNNYSKANPGGFVAGLGDPNATNPGGFYICPNPSYHPDNRKGSMPPINKNNNQVKNDSNSNNIIQTPMPNLPYSLNNSNNFPSPISPLTSNYPHPPSRDNSSNSYPHPPSRDNSSNSYPPIHPSPNNYMPPINPLSTNSYPQLSPADLQRRFYGTCKACDKPNSDFAECATCKDWLRQMEKKIKERKSLINQQLCIKCHLPKHVHNQIAACAKCGFPKSCLKELNKTATKCENENDNNNNNNNTLICGNCNDPLENYLKCPTFTEVSQRMRKERECLPYEDPNFAKLNKVIKV